MTIKQTVAKPSEMVRAPKGSMWFLPSSNTTRLTSQIHAAAAKCGAKASCQKWFAFCPKDPRGIRELLRVEIIKPGAARKKPGRKKKPAAS